MIVKVTQEHIDKGKRRHLTNCPVALALKDTFKVSKVRVSSNSLTIGVFPVDNIIFETLTPIVASKFIDDYDILEEFKPEPFEFELSLEGVKL